jgi:hypothetical protein
MSESKDDVDAARRALGLLGLAGLAACAKEAVAGVESTGTVSSALGDDGGTSSQGGASSLIVADVPSVATIDPSGLLPTGATMFVQSLRSRFLLDRQSPLPADGNYVIAASAGGGNWVRTPQGDNNGKIVIPTGQGLYLAQGGTPAAPTLEQPVVLQPLETNRAPFTIRLSTTKFNSTNDYVMYQGYNVNRGIGGEPVAYWALECDFEYIPGSHKLEHYCECAASPSAPAIRPFGYTLVRETNEVDISLWYAGAPGFQLLGGPVGGGPVQQWSVTDGQMTLFPDPYVIASRGFLSIYSEGGKTLQLQSTGQLNIIAAPGHQMYWAADTVVLARGDTTQYGQITTDPSSSIHIATAPAGAVTDVLVLAPPQGRANTQSGRGITEFLAVLTTQGSTPASVNTAYLPPPGMGASLSVEYAGRDLSDGSMASGTVQCAVKNVGNAVSLDGTPVVLGKCGGSTVAQSTIATVVANGAVAIQVTPPASFSDSVDWRFHVRVVEC